MHMRSKENSKELISLVNVSRLFQTEKIDTFALHNVDLHISSGDYVAIMGPSGSGKSTLMAILGLLDRPSEGEYWIDGVSTQNLSDRERAAVRNNELGFVFQDFNLIGDMTVFQNVELPLTHRQMSKAERQQRVRECLARVGLGERSDHFPSQLSGGQQQRTAVARAVVGRPKILLADEPTGNLDSANGRAVMDLLAELNREGVTICMVTHDLRYADDAKRVIHLFDGKVKEDNLLEVAR